MAWLSINPFPGCSLHKSTDPCQRGRGKFSSGKHPKIAVLSTFPEDHLPTSAKTRRRFPIICEKKDGRIRPAILATSCHKTCYWGDMAEHVPHVTFGAFQVASGFHATHGSADSIPALGSTCSTVLLDQCWIYIHYISLYIVTVLYAFLVFSWARAVLGRSRGMGTYCWWLTVHGRLVLIDGQGHCVH